MSLSRLLLVSVCLCSHGLLDHSSAAEDDKIVGLKHLLRQPGISRLQNPTFNTENGETCEYSNPAFAKDKQLRDLQSIRDLLGVTGSSFADDNFAKFSSTSRSGAMMFSGRSYFVKTVSSTDAMKYYEMASDIKDRMTDTKSPSSISPLLWLVQLQCYSSGFTSDIMRSLASDTWYMAVQENIKQSFASIQVGAVVVDTAQATKEQTSTRNRSVNVVHAVGRARPVEESAHPALQFEFDLKGSMLTRAVDTFTYTSAGKDLDYINQGVAAMRISLDGQNDADKVEEEDRIGKDIVDLTDLRVKLLKAQNDEARCTAIRRLISATVTKLSKLKRARRKPVKTFLHSRMAGITRDTALFEKHEVMDYSVLAHVTEINLETDVVGKYDFRLNDPNTQKQWGINFKIIDYLETYDTSKRVEAYVKLLKTQKGVASSVNPTYYRNRFLAMANEILLHAVKVRPPLRDFNGRTYQEWMEFVREFELPDDPRGEFLFSVGEVAYVAYANRLRGRLWLLMSRSHSLAEEQASNHTSTRALSYFGGEVTPYFDGLESARSDASDDETLNSTLDSFPRLCSLPTEATKGKSTCGIYNNYHLPFGCGMDPAVVKFTLATYRNPEEYSHCPCENFCEGPGAFCTHRCISVEQLDANTFFFRRRIKVYHLKMQAGTLMCISPGT